MLLVNEFDYAPAAVDLFRDNYLEVSHHGSAPIDYPYAYIAPSNTGVPSGHDLDNNGSIGGGNDAFGFGLFEGQFGMVVYSKYPIDTDAVRTFQTSVGRHARRDAARRPGHARSRPTGTPRAELDDVRLSSKSHWDVPIRTSTAPPSTSSSRTRRRRSSTAPRTATAPATTTRSASGPTTSGRTSHARPTSTTTRACTGGLPATSGS